jgi:hypothetical protein
MAFERSKFGDGSASGAGNVTKTVHTHYGRRDVGKGTGDLYTAGAVKEVVFDLDGDVVGAEEFALEAPIIREGSRILEAYVEVTEAFVLGGTSPTVEIGTEGSEATNGVTITEAQAEAVGVYDVTSALAGTWAGTTGLAADTTVGIEMGGTSPTSGSAGKARVVVRYFRA